MASSKGMLLTQEVIYQRCLALELKNTGMHYDREVEMPIFTMEPKLERDGLILSSKIKL